MNHLRLLQFRLLLVGVCTAALVLPGCSSFTSNGQVLPRSNVTAKGLHPHGTEWRVTIRNYTQRYVWVTRYWSNQWNAGWHVEGGNCIAPYADITEAVFFTLKGLNETRLRAEIKSAGSTNCHGSNDHDIWGTPCGPLPLHFYRAEAFVDSPSLADAHWKIRTFCKVNR